MICHPLPPGQPAQLLCKACGTVEEDWDWENKSVGNRTKFISCCQLCGLAILFCGPTFYCSSSIALELIPLHTRSPYEPQPRQLVVEKGREETTTRVSPPPSREVVLVNYLFLMGNSSCAHVPYLHYIHMHRSRWLGVQLNGCQEQ